MPIAYVYDDETHCRDCFDNEYEGDVSTIRWTTDWYDESMDHEYQELRCDECLDLLDEWVPEEPDEDSGYCNCDDCDASGRDPTVQPVNLAAYMAAFIRSATPAVAGR